MARVVNKDDYELRRTKILEAAQSLVYTKGYDQLSIHDILVELHISKGAFYHYFGSKQALLEALIERLATQVVQVLTPVVQDDRLSATEKLLRIFDVAARWKTNRKDYLLTLVRVWYADENAVLRLKAQAAVIPLVAPLLTTVIRQGTIEGVLHTSFPDQACEIVFSLLQSFGDSLIKLILQPDFTTKTLPHLEAVTASYQEAIERILGATPGSLPLFDPAIFREWMPLS